jgi:hypothetical protein
VGIELVAEILFTVYVRSIVDDWVVALWEYTIIPQAGGDRVHDGAIGVRSQSVVANKELLHHRVQTCGVLNRGLVTNTLDHDVGPVAFLVDNTCELIRVVVPGSDGLVLETLNTTKGRVLDDGYWRRSIRQLVALLKTMTHTLDGKVSAKHIIVADVQDHLHIILSHVLSERVEEVHGLFARVLDADTGIVVPGEVLNCGPELISGRVEGLEDGGIYFKKEKFNKLLTCLSRVYAYHSCSRKGRGRQARGFAHWGCQRTRGKRDLD